MSRKRRELRPDDAAFLEVLFTGGPIETHKVSPGTVERLNKWFGNTLICDVKLGTRDFLDLTEEGKYYMGADWDDIERVVDADEAASAEALLLDGSRDDELKVPLYRCPFCDTAQPGRYICESCGESADQSPGDDGEELTWDSPGIGHG